MIWIMGAEEIVHGMAKVTGSHFWEGFATQMTHPDWNGFHFYDLIFPLFLFMAGVATPYSVGRELEKGKAKQQLLLRVIRRGLVLVLLGVIYNNGLELRPISELRLPSVLGRIGLAYMFANIIYLYTTQRSQIIWFFSLLFGYWFLLMFSSAPGYPMGDLTMEGNFASYLDRLIVPGKFYLGIHDPEGLISTIPAIGTGLLGIYAGNFLKNNPITMERKALQLLVIGIIFLIAAQVWNLVFPINKNLWTSSFVLQTGGWSLILLAIFYYIIDVKGYKRWAFFFSVIGMNSILIYMSDSFINWRYTTTAIFQWLSQLVGDPYNLVVMAICFVMVKWTFLYVLYKKDIFLRV
ncbi:MAG: DUF5009 domain-containing protein [Bacteroidia bacterium]|nr:DUF5009 domain-containing protein [Bacteroidia bacterium]